MYGRTRYIVITLVIILVFLLGLLLFRGGKKSSNTKTSSSSTSQAPPKVISDYNTPSSFVRLTIDGQVNSNQLHRMIRITVSQSQSNLDVFQGYQYQSLSSSTYNSNSAAYNDFLHGLQNAGFDKDRKTKQTDYAGMCPLGLRYIYEVFDNNVQISSRWSTSCGNLGTYGGTATLTSTLFKSQIPNYSKQTSGVPL